jgi:hypothetical protein
MQKRELWKVVVFGLVKFGIYEIVWLYKTRNEMVAKGQKIPSFWLLFLPILLLIAVAVLQFIMHFILAGVTPDAPVQEARLGSQIVNIFSVVAGILAILAIIPISLYWTYKYCKAVETVTKGNTSVSFAFWLWLLLNIFSVGFIWPGLIQDSFNKNT